jgi:hypothetical protein
MFETTETGMFATRRLRLALALALSGFASVAIAAGVGPSTAAGSETVAVVPTPVPAAASLTVLSASPGCPDRHACIWGQPNYDGQRNAYDWPWAGPWWQTPDFNRNSAKNRFDSRKFKIGRYQPLTGTIHVISCMDPREDRPDPGWFDSFHISEITSDVCG